MIQGTKISEIAEKTSLNGKEYIPIQDGNANKKVKTDKLVQKSQLATINGQRIDEPKNIVVGGGSGGSVIVDSALSSTSVNPVQNKVVTEKLAQLEDKTKDTVHSSEREEKIELSTEGGKTDYLGDVFPCCEGTSITVDTLTANMFKVIAYFSDVAGTQDLQFVDHTFGGGYHNFSLAAPKGTKSAKIRGQYQKDYPFIAKITHPIAEMIEAYKALAKLDNGEGNENKPDITGQAIPSSEREELVVLEGEKNGTTSRYVTEPLPCVEGTIVSVETLTPNKFKVITFYSDTSAVHEIKYIDHEFASGYHEFTLTAPKGTKSVVIRGQYRQNFPLKIKAVHPMAEMIEAFKAIKMIEKEVYSGGNDFNIIGDSIAQGIAGGFRVLQPFNPQLGKVWSNGVGGETTLATLERQGSLPLMVYPFTLKRGNLSVDVCAISQKLAKDTYDKETGLVVYPPLWNKYKNKTGFTEDNGNVFVPFNVNNLGGILEGELNGVKCTIKYDDNKGMTINVDKPLEEDWVCTSPSELKPSNSEKYRSLITVCEMGTNGGFNFYDGNNEIIGLAGTIPWNQAYLNPGINGENTEENKRIANRIADNLVSEYKTARNYCYHPEKFIAVGFYSRSFANSYFYPIYEAKMTAEFGANFFNAREYLIRDGWRDCGYPLSVGDIEDINKGIVPRCFFGESTGGAHISKRGNTAIAYKILMRCYELNIVDFVPKIVDLNTIVDFRYRISGTIKNVEGAPLKGATVSLYIDILDPVVKATDANGFFRFQELVTENSTMHIKVEMAGYQTYESPVVTFADKEYNVILQRL